MIPGARKSRYELFPVLIAWIRLNVSPKISSQSTGCTARVKSSVRSWLSFCSSTMQNVSVRLGNVCQSGRAAGRSADAAGSPASTADLTQAPLSDLFAVERVARLTTEHVLEGRPGAERA